MTLQQRKEIEAKARKLGVSLSEFVRLALRAEEESTAVEAAELRILAHAARRSKRRSPLPDPSGVCE
jgi:hypothetical protein